MWSIKLIDVISGFLIFCFLYVVHETHICNIRFPYILFISYIYFAYKIPIYGTYNGPIHFLYVKHIIFIYGMSYKCHINGI